MCTDITALMENFWVLILGNIILIHVDDVLYAGNAKFKTTVSKELMKHFEISKTFEGTFTYI